MNKIYKQYNELKQNKLTQNKLR